LAEFCAGIFAPLNFAPPTFALIFGQAIFLAKILKYLFHCQK
jgi:hypothetical protein